MRGGLSLVGSPTRRTIAIVLLAASIRLLFFTGFHGFDDVFYIKRAYVLSEGVFSLPTNQWAARLGVVGPTALVYRLFGVTLATTVAFPFICSLLTVVVAASLGRRLFGEDVGWISALLVAIFPMDAIFASMLFPTAPVTLCCGLGYGLFLLGEAGDRSNCYFAAGAAFGVACVIHEAALIALVFYPVVVVSRRDFSRGHLLAVVGFATALFIDPVVHGLMGSATARLDVLARSATAQGTAADVAYKGLNARWLLEPPLRLVTERTFGLFPWLIAPLAVHRGLRPTDPRDRVLSLIVISVFLWTEYGTLSFHRYAPLARLPRYLCPLTLPAMWLLARFIGGFGHPRLRAGLVGLLAVSSLTCLVFDSGNQLRPYQSIRSALASVHPRVVVVEKVDEFPLRFAEGMKPPYALSVLGATVPAHALVVARSPEALRRFQDAPEVERVATVTRPRSLYQSTLSNPLVLAILHAVRPPERAAGYQDRALLDTWTILQLP